jgi:hypothetical protein
MLDSITFAFSTQTLGITAALFLLALIVGSILIQPHNRLPGRGDHPFPIKCLNRKTFFEALQCAW